MTRSPTRARWQWSADGAASPRSRILVFVETGPDGGFEHAVARLGFGEVQERRGVRFFSASPTPYLTYWVHLQQDGTALFTWEFAIAEYMATLGLQVGSDEHLNTFLFPREDVRGPQDPAWLAAQIERTEALLRSISLLGDQGPAEDL